ncbi:MAG: hypothetical protein F6J94_19445 [Moorea sp. SIO1F2]|nr:hypothetical protein [Moorena sp. SIO1F2]NET84013.1 hypothetical protein [Moorena sp. SIO1F2]
MSYLLSTPYSLFPIPYSLLPKNQDFVPHPIYKCYIFSWMQSLRYFT